MTSKYFEKHFAKFEQSESISIMDKDLNTIDNGVITALSFQKELEFQPKSITVTLDNDSNRQYEFYGSYRVNACNLSTKERFSEVVIYNEPDLNAANKNSLLEQYSRLIYHSNQYAAKIEFMTESEMDAVINHLKEIEAILSPVLHRIHKHREENKIKTGMSLKTFLSAWGVQVSTYDDAKKRSVVQSMSDIRDFSTHFSEVMKSKH